jgi:DNA-binding NarL/FixJ family response regulator
MEIIKVLVVDDHAVMRDGLRALLDLYDDIEIAGEASDGKEAIERVKEFCPHVVVMDIAMPSMDGLEATRHIKKNNSTTKILALTQHDNKEYIIAAIKAGVAGFLPKTAQGSEIVSAIRKISMDDYFLYPSAASALIDAYRDTIKEEPYDQLTAREREMLKLIADGYTNQEIATMLDISIKTVAGHRAKIMEKLDLHNRTELVKYAIRKGLTNTDK